MITCVRVSLFIVCVYMCGVGGIGAKQAAHTRNNYWNNKKSNPANTAYAKGKGENVIVGMAKLTNNLQLTLKNLLQTSSRIKM